MWVTARSDDGPSTLIRTPCSASPAATPDAPATGIMTMLVSTEASSTAPGHASLMALASDDAARWSSTIRSMLCSTAYSPAAASSPA